MSEEPLVITISSESEGEGELLDTSYRRRGRKKLLNKSNFSLKKKREEEEKARERDALFDRLLLQGPTNASFKSSEYSGSAELEAPSFSSDSSFYESPIRVPPVVVVEDDETEVVSPPAPPFPHERRQPAPRKKGPPLTPLSFLSSLSEVPPGFAAHPHALPYKKAFKKNRPALAQYLFNMFNEQVFEKRLPQDMEVFWTGRLRNTSGVTYSKSILSQGALLYVARIGLSTQVITTPERLRDTLIHEMCHAATWIIDRVKEGHGQNWKRWTQVARDKFPELPPIKVCHEYEIKRKFTYECTSCKYKIGRNTKSLDTVRFKCGYCGGRFTVYSTSRGLQPNDDDSTSTKEKKLTPFALYVKNNYASLKDQHPHMSHKERMTHLGTQFKLNKLKVDSNLEEVTRELQQITFNK